MSKNKKITVPDIINRKQTKTHISAVTAYDFTFAQILNQTQIDIVLVGDSLGCVVQGYNNTVSVTLDEMIYHTRCVSRGLTRPLLVADLPFLSYQVSGEKAIESAGRLLKEGYAEAVKLEGGVVVKDTIERLVSIDIPVMGHVGLTPQSYHRMGGHKIQGRKQAGLEPGTAERIIADAEAVANAGAFAVVLEGIPQQLATQITELISIPTIGIAAGSGCDGQIRVIYDLLGLTQSGAPSSVQAEISLAELVIKAVKNI
jgi:3-methyl-2-oxobutanoate hydroxymethyltransferase